MVKDREYLTGGCVFSSLKCHVSDCPVHTQRKALELADFPVANCTLLPLFADDTVPWTAGANFEKKVFEVLVDFMMLRRDRYHHMLLLQFTLHCHFSF